MRDLQKETKHMKPREAYEHVMQTCEELQPTNRKPRSLKADQIKVLKIIFQHRDYYEDRCRKMAHVQVLTSRINSGEDLDPITVFAIGDDFYCVDGHHRLSAYKSAKAKPKVPVAIFNGTFKEAYAHALEGNSIDKLPMTKAEKSEAAWKMVLTGNYSKKEIIATRMASEGTVANMRRTLAQLKAEEHDPDGMTWEQARKEAKGESTEIDEDWMEKQARVYAAKFGRVFGPNPPKNPELLWTSLMYYSQQSADVLEEYILENRCTEEIGETDADEWDYSPIQDDVEEADDTEDEF